MNGCLRTGSGGSACSPHNVKDEQQTLKLMEEVQAIAGDSGIPQPYYVSIDEEGGTLSKFKTFYPYIPGNRAAGLSLDAETAYLQGKNHRQPAPRAGHPDELGASAGCEYEYRQSGCRGALLRRRP
ncbi:hypothetical protein ACFSQ7_26050 [Paenibacillus rhizoplanae]